MRSEWSYQDSRIEPQPNTANYHLLCLEDCCCVHWGSIHAIHPSRYNNAVRMVVSTSFSLAGFDFCSSRQPTRIKIQLHPSNPSSKRANRLLVVVSNQAEMEPGAQSGSNARRDALSRRFLSSQESFFALFRFDTTSEFEIKIECNAMPEPHNNKHHQYQPLHWASI
jgi:hypothetical protein